MDGQQSAATLYKLHKGLLLSITYFIVVGIDQKSIIQLEIGRSKILRIRGIGKVEAFWTQSRSQQNCQEEDSRLWCNHASRVTKHDSTIGSQRVERNHSTLHLHIHVHIYLNARDLLITTLRDLSRLDEKHLCRTIVSFFSFDSSHKRKLSYFYVTD